MVFEHPQYLFLLLLIPVYWFISEWNRRVFEKKISIIGDTHWVKKNLKNFNPNYHRFSPYLYGVALGLLILAIANPLFGSKNTTITARKMNIVFAIDVSTSMLCEDLKPNRLEKAKLLAYQLLQQLDAENVGVIVFAGEAYLQLPLSNDVEAAAMLFQSLTTDMLTTQGTNLNAVFETVKEIASSSDNPTTLLLLTDGENHEMENQKFLQNIDNQDFKSCFFSTGTAEGGSIPLRKGSFTIEKKDENGQTIVTKADKVFLKNIAQQLDADYYDAENITTADLATIAKKITNNAAQSQLNISHKDKASQYHWCLMASILLFGVGFYWRNFFLAR